MPELLPRILAGAVAATAVTSFAVGIAGVRDLSGRVDAAAHDRAARLELVQRERTALSPRPAPRAPRHHGAPA